MSYAVLTKLHFPNLCVLVPHVFVHKTLKLTEVYLCYILPGTCKRLWGAHSIGNYISSRGTFAFSQQSHSSALVY